MSRNFLLALMGVLVMLCGAILPLAAQTPTASSLTGTIEQASSTQLTLQTSGHSVVLALTSATAIKVDGKVVMAGDLKAGMSAIAFAADGKTATEIRAYSPRITTPTPPATQTALTGVINQVGGGQLTLQTSTQTITVTLTTATVTKVDGKLVGAGDLKAGMSAMVFATDGKIATEVRAYTPKPATQPPAATGQTGTITQIGDGQLTLQASGKTLVFTLANTTVTKVDGKVVGVGDIKTGMTAIVFSTDGKIATEVRAYTPKPTTQPPTTQPPVATGQTGTITQIGDGQLTLKGASQTLVFMLTSATVTKVDGKVVGAGDIKTGMTAIVFATDGKTATEVRAYTPKPTTQPPTTQPPTTQPPAAAGQTGTITQVSNDRVTLQSSIHTVSFALTPATVIHLDGKPAAIADLKADLSAIVISTDGTTATEVRAYTPPVH